MIKIYRNFFDNHILEFLKQKSELCWSVNNKAWHFGESKDERIKSGCAFNTSYALWDSRIVQDSPPILLYEIPEYEELKEIVAVFRKIFEFQNYQFYFYFWPSGSYLPWHDDGNIVASGTLYLNPMWSRDWGGVLIYHAENSNNMEDKIAWRAGQSQGDVKLLAEYPEYNKIIILQNNVEHTVTPITKPLFHQPNGPWLPSIPMIRTTFQFFLT